MACSTLWGIAAVQRQHPKVNVGFLYGKIFGRARNGRAFRRFLQMGSLLGFINREREKARFLMALVESISSLFFSLSVWEKNDRADSGPFGIRVLCVWKG